MQIRTEKAVKTWIFIALAACLALTGTALPVAGKTPAQPPAGQIAGLDLASASAILMEESTGEVLYEKNSRQELPPASVSKVMTMLLIMEAVDSGKIRLTDKVFASENATAKGGSQIYLEPGEEMTVDTLLKSIAVASANDACVALAEYIGGTEQSFVDMMNDKVKKLGLKNTHFVNTNGLPPDDSNDIGNYSSAYDIAVMSRELMKHPRIHKYMTIWMEPIRDGKFMLTNTNKLIRFYRGADGIKTGYTEKARHCLASTAIRDGVRVIAVVMGAPDSATRFREASALMDIGFSKYKSIKVVKKGEVIAELPVLKGVADRVRVAAGADLVSVLRREDDEKYSRRITLKESVSAPVKKGQKLGELAAVKNGRTLGKVDLVAKGGVEKGSIVKVVVDTGKSLVRSIFKVKTPVAGNASK